MNNMISVIVPVYNVEKYICETIRSVEQQTYEDWELLLVEDGSRDGSRVVIEDYIKASGRENIRLIVQPKNGGAAKARNRGLQEARGRYIAYLDGDDLWMPDKLEKQISFLKKKDATFVFTGYEFANEAGEGTGKVVRVPAQLSYRHALGNTTIFTSTVMFDTEKISKEQLEMPCVKSEDTALWFRILRGGRMAYGLDENLVKYRRVGKSLSSNKIEAMRRIWNLYRQCEKLPLLTSVWYFCHWAIRAVKRRV